MTQYTTYDWREPEEPEDIVEALRKADAENKKMIEGAMVIRVGKPQPLSLLERAAEEIEKLRRIVGITEN
jgi:hypothetical protein